MLFMDTLESRTGPRVGNGLLVVGDPGGGSRIWLYLKVQGHKGVCRDGEIEYGRQHIP